MDRGFRAFLGAASVLRLTLGLSQDWNFLSWDSSPNVSHCFLGRLGALSDDSSGFRMG
jgi:hypothetical protein